MPDASVFTHGESDEPGEIYDDLLDQQIKWEIEDKASLRELISDHLGMGVATYDMYSKYSMLNAIWALQQIEKLKGVGVDEALYEAVEIAKKALAEIAISGDFEEHVDFDGDGESFRPAPVDRTKNGAFTWKSDPE